MMVNLLLFSPLLRAQLLCVHFVHSCWTLRRRSLMCNYSTHANASLSRLSIKKEKKEIIFCSALCVSSSVILNFKKPLRRSPSLSLLVLLWSGTLWLWTTGLYSNKVRNIFFGVSKLAQSHQLFIPTSHLQFNSIDRVLSYQQNEWQGRKLLIELLRLWPLSIAPMLTPHWTIESFSKKSRRSCFHIFFTLVELLLLVSLYNVCVNIWYRNYASSRFYIRVLKARESRRQWAVEPNDLCSRTEQARQVEFLWRCDSVC